MNFANVESAASAFHAASSTICHMATAEHLAICGGVAVGTPPCIPGHTRQRLAGKTWSRHTEHPRSPQHVADNPGQGAQVEHAKTHDTLQLKKASPHTSQHDLQNAWPQSKLHMSLSGNSSMQLRHSTTSSSASSPATVELLPLCAPPPFSVTTGVLTWPSSATDGCATRWPLADKASGPSLVYMSTSFSASHRQRNNNTFATFIGRSNAAHTSSNSRLFSRATSSAAHTTSLVCAASQFYSAHARLNQQGRGTHLPSKRRHHRHQRGGTLAVLLRHASVSIGRCRRAGHSSPHRRARRAGFRPTHFTGTEASHIIRKAARITLPLRRLHLTHERPRLVRG